MPDAPHHMPPWPPAWNPFEVFLLVLSLLSSVSLLQGTTGSAILDQRLNPVDVVGWGLCLAGGSVLALAGVYCYRGRRRLMMGLYLERAGLVLVGGAASLYTYVVLHSAADIGDARYASAVQIAYASACFFRAWQDHQAIRWTYKNHNEGVGV